MMAPGFARLLIAAAKRLGGAHYITDGVCVLVGDIRDLPPGVQALTAADFP